MLNLLLEIRPYVPGVGSTTIRMASAANNDSSGTQLDGYEWHPLLTSGPTYSFGFTSGENGLLTTPTTDLGQVEFRMGEIYDNEIWSTYDWNNAQCRMWIGEVGQPFTAYRKLFEATSSGLTRDGVTAALKLRALTVRLDKPLLDEKYAGTGGAEGPPEMKGRVKPMALGNCLSVDPVVVDAARWIFQVHGYGPVEDIVQVYDFAQPVGELVASVSTYEELAALELLPAQWAKCNALGMFRLGGASDEKISADVLGGRFFGQFPDTVADIVPALLRRAGFSASQIGSFASLPNKGWSYYSREDALIGDVARKAVLDAGGYLFNDNEGRWQVGNAFAPKPAKPLLADGSAEPSVGSIRELNVADPLWQFEVGYDPCWAVHSISDISPKLLELAGTINEQAEALDEIRDLADLAKEQSELAQQEIDNILADGILDRSEKVDLIADLEAAAAQRSEIASEINQYQAATQWAAYQAAHNALVAYVSGLSPSIYDTSVSTPVDRLAFRARWAAYFEAYQAVLNAMVGDARKVAIWENISGIGKPEDNATVGAPVGTEVAGKPAEVLLDEVQTIDNNLNDLGLEVAGIGGKVEAIDTDLEDAKGQITDLFTTYGSTTNAATSAQQALDAARDSNAAKELAEAAAGTSTAIEGRIAQIESNVSGIQTQTGLIRDQARDLAQEAGDHARYAEEQKDLAIQARNQSGDFADAASQHKDAAFGFLTDAEIAAGISSSRKLEAEIARDAARRAAGRTFVGDFFNELDFWRFSETQPKSYYFYEGGFGASGKTLAATVDGAQGYLVISPKEPIKGGANRRWRLTVNGIWTPEPQNHPNSYTYLRAIHLNGHIRSGVSVSWGVAGQNQLNPVLEFVTDTDQPFYPQIVVEARNGDLQIHVYSMTCVDITEEHNAAQHAAASFRDSQNAFVYADDARELAGVATEQAGIAITEAGTATTKARDAALSEYNAGLHVVEAGRLAGLSATTLTDTREILHRSWPPSFTPEGRLAYNTPSDHGQWENGHGGGDPYAWHNFASDPSHVRYILFNKSRPRVLGRRYRVSCYVWQNLAGPHRFQIYGLSGGSPDASANERYHGPLGNGVRTDLPTSSWTRVESEFVMDGYFLNHWRPVIEIIRTDNQPFGGDWYVTGMTVEDVTATQESKQFATASAQEAETARVRRDEAGNHAEAARLRMLDAQSAAGTSNTRAGQAETSRVEAGKHEAKALEYRNQSAEFSTSSQSAYNRFIERDGNLDFRAGWDGWSTNVDGALTPQPSWVLVEDNSFGRGRHFRFDPSGGWDITTRKTFSRIPGRIYKIDTSIAAYHPTPGGQSIFYVSLRLYDGAGTYLYELHKIADNRAVPNGQYVPVSATFTDSDFPQECASFRLHVYVHWNGGSGVYGYLGPVTFTDVTSERAAFSAAGVAAGHASTADEHRASAATQAGLSAIYKNEAIRSASAATVPPFMENFDFWFFTEGTQDQVANEYYLGQWCIRSNIPGNHYSLLRNRYPLWVQPGSTVRATVDVQCQEADCPNATHTVRFAWYDSAGNRHLRDGNNPAINVGTFGQRRRHVNEFVIPDGVDRIFVETYIFPNRGDAGRRQFLWWNAQLEDVSALKSAESFADLSNDAYTLADGQRALALEQAQIAASHASSALNSFALSRPNSLDPEGRKAHVFEVPPTRWDGPSSGWPTPYIGWWPAGTVGWEWAARQKKWLPKQVGRTYRMGAWVFSYATNVRFFTGIHGGNAEGSVEVFHGFGLPLPNGTNDVTPQSPGFVYVACEFQVTDVFYPWIGPYIGVKTTDGQPANGGYHIGPVLLEDVTSVVSTAANASIANSRATTATEAAAEAVEMRRQTVSFKDEAKDYRDDAFGFAGQAEGAASRASGSETATSNYLTQMSSFGSQSMVKNSYFAAPNWTGDAPPRWGIWANDNNVFIGKYGANADRPNPYGPNALQIDRNGNNAGIAQGIGPCSAGWYVIEADLWVQDGVWQGVGIHVQFNNGTAHNLDMGLDRDINGDLITGVNFRNRKFSKLVHVPAPSPEVSFYVMASWTGFSGGGAGLGFARTIWHKALLRPATQGEIDGRQAKISADANTAAINEERQTRTNNEGAIAGRVQTVEARATNLERRPDGGGNWLADTEFPNRKRYGWTTYEFAGAQGSYGINEPNNEWAPFGENTLSIYQSNAPGAVNGMNYVSSRVPVVANSFVQFYAWAAAHRCYVEFFLEFFREDGSLSGYANSFTGWQRVGGGGRNPANYSRIGQYVVKVPDDAVSCQLVLRKLGTDAGQPDSYAWFWRPYLGPAREGQQEWNPYVHGSGKLASQSVEARVTTTEGAVADINGAAAFTETVVAASGSNPAIMSLKAGKNGSAINLTGDRIVMRNQVNGQVVEVASFEGGIAQLNNALIRRLRVAPRSNSQIFLPVMLRPIIRIGSDGQWINYQNGETFGANPERITPDLNGLPALAAGESYDIRAVNVGPTGFTAYAKKITAAEPVVQNSGAGTNVGGTPQWRAHKPTALDAYNGNYQFTFQIVGQLIGSEPAPGGGGFYDYRATGDIYLADTNGNMSIVGGYNEGWGGFNASGTRYITVTVTSNIPVGQTGNYEFGVHPTVGAITAFDSVIYATQVQSNVSSLSSPISWVISPPTPDE